MLWKAEEVKRGLLGLLQPKSFHDSMTETKKDKNRHRERDFGPDTEKGKKKKKISVRPYI